MKNKATQRLEQAEIKKNLAKFGKEEYRTKKPIELRLIQLKPQIIFKKGSVLPNLLIKSLQHTYYVIYLDYGAEIRFYFFGRTGESLGASTYPKTDKMLSEMHGKGNTLLKLPKIDPNDVLDTETMKIRDKFNDLITKYSNLYGIKVTKQPTISVKKINMEKNSIRIGITQEHSPSNHLMFNRELIEPNRELIEPVLLREILPLLINVPSQKESIQFIASIWMMGMIHETEQKEYLNYIHEIHFNNIITKKGMEWLEKMFVPKISTIELKFMNFSDFFLKLVQNLIHFYDLSQSEIWDIFILWLMKSGLKKTLVFVDTMDSKESLDKYLTAFLLYELTLFLFSNQELWKKYQVSVPLMKNHSKYLLQNIYGYSVMNFSPLQGLNTISEQFTELQNIPEYQKWIEQIENLELLEFFTQLPEKLRMANEEILNKLILHQLMVRAYKIDCVDSIILKMNSAERTKFQITNQSDWILHNITFKLKILPESRITGKISQLPPVKIFDKQIDFELEFKRLTPGQAKCIIEIEFQDFISPKIRTILPLTTIIFH